MISPERLLPIHAMLHEILSTDGLTLPDVVSRVEQAEAKLWAMVEGPLCDDFISSLNDDQLRAIAEFKPGMVKAAAERTLSGRQGRGF